MAEQLYHSDGNSVSFYKLGLDSLTPTATVASTTPAPAGIGGITDRLFYVDFNPDNIYEIDPDTLTITNTVSAPSTSPWGIGGTEDRLYHCDNISDKIYEIDPDTLLVSNTVTSPSIQPLGVGGIADRLYHCDNNTDSLYEINKDTLLVINTVSAPGTGTYGIGGVNGRLYHSATGGFFVYEIDPDTLLAINTVASPNYAPWGIGGKKESLIAEITITTQSKMNEIKCEWTAVIGFDTYTLRYKKTTDSTFSTKTGITTEEYTMTGLEKGVEYDIEVDALDGSNVVIGEGDATATTTLADNYIISAVTGVSNLGFAGIITQTVEDEMIGEMKRTAGNSGRKDVTSGSKQVWEIKTQATEESLLLYRKMYAYLKARMWQKESIYLDILNGSISGFIAISTDRDIRGKDNTRQFVTMTIREA